MTNEMFAHLLERIEICVGQMIRTSLIEKKREKGRERTRERERGRERERMKGTVKERRKGR